MEKFKCQNPECKISALEDDEDNRLMMIVEEGQVTKYHIRNDGSLEFWDSDGTGQTIYLECQLCGDRWEFDGDYFEVQQQHVLPFGKDELSELKLRRIE